MTNPYSGGSDWNSRGPRELTPTSHDGEILNHSGPISTEAMERFVRVFEKSARRWEIVIYPAMFAFVVLAAYGFFLIYSLTGDIHTMARSIDPEMGEHMQVMADSIDEMTASMDEVSETMKQVSAKLDTLEPMLAHVKYMDHSMRVMTRSNDQMRHSVAVMSHNVSRPMSVINSFMP